MGETFLININCSKILVDNDETQYTMFIDRTKMSIVFELIEWIRWMFSIDNCIYLMHENSVIHELEDIQVLSRLKNFEIKPCGRFQCVHKKMYRTLLNNCNMFVFWNETKIHKYFLDKINQISQKLTVESGEHLKITKFKENVENETAETNKNKTICFESAFLKKQLEKSSLGDSPLNKKRASIDNYEFKVRPNSKSSNDINMSLNSPLKSKEDNIKHSEGSICFKDSYNSSSKNFIPENNNSIFPASVNNSLKNELIKPETSKNIAKSKTEKCFTKFRPFSLGEILSNIREDFKKEQKETALVQKNISCSLMCEEENFDEKMSVTESLYIENNPTESKKRQRTRRRKRSKAKSSENTDFAFDLFQVAPTCKSPKSSCNLKPSHIRFDINDENNLAEAECVDDKLNENEFEMCLKTEPKQPVTPIKNNCQSLLDLPPISSAVIDIDSEMKCLEYVDPKICEEKLIDLENTDCNKSSLTKDFEQSSVGQDFTMLDSLKEKFKSSVVIERFY